MTLALVFALLLPSAHAAVMRPVAPVSARAAAPRTLPALLSPGLPLTAASPSVAPAPAPSLDAVWGESGRVEAPAVAALAPAALARADEHGRVTPELQAELSRIEARRASVFTPGARRVWQGLLSRLGARTALPYVMPAEDTPFWQRDGHPLEAFRSTPELPRRADIVIIGAGLTGAAAALRLAKDPRAKGLKVVVLDAKDAATEASGRNGGNFQFIPEHYTGDYDGMVGERLKIMRALRPQAPLEVLRALAKRQFELILRIAGVNRDILLDNIRSEGIEAGLSANGAVRVAMTEREERGLADDAARATAQGVPMSMLEPGRADELLGAAPGTTARAARHSPNDGNYHPFQYVIGVLKAALSRGVELHSRTPVTRLNRLSGGGHAVVTPRGTIRAKTVILATNGFTSKLVPELSEIAPYRSQIMTTEHAPHRWNKMTYTTEKGDLYGHYPLHGSYQDGEVRRGVLLLGGGKDRPVRSTENMRRSPWTLRKVLRYRDLLAPELAGIPPSSVWFGVMGFTRDRLPVVGTVRAGLLVAAGFNGYGGTYTQAAAHAVVELLLSGRHPDWMPEDVFSPRRFRAKP